jgi:hypothetical protein
MTKKELMAVVDNQLPKGLKCTRVRYPRFTKNEVENGAHLMGVWTDNSIYIMAWFRYHSVDLSFHSIRLSICENDWELILTTK